MKPAARRRAEREITAIMRADGDHCSVCRLALPHNSRTFGGAMKSGTIVLAGECCQAKVRDVVLEGLYLDGTVDDLVSLVSATAKRPGPSSSGAAAIDAAQSLFAKLQGEGEDVARQGGLASGPAKVFRQPTSWKDDDARWFELRPDRSHRLRPLIGDEAAKTGFSMDVPLPPNHEMQVVVRQIEPGKRARLPFARNLSVPIPDEESSIHALFDILADRGGSGQVISPKMMRKAVGRYNQNGKTRPS